MGPKWTLLVTMGLPYSGKSTWARAQSFPVVCVDAIRWAIHGERFIAEAEKEVWKVAQIMVKALFRAGHEDVILDITANTKKRRDPWQNEMWETLFVPFGIDPKMCIQRAKEAGDTGIMHIIEKMAKEHEPLDPETEYQLQV